MRTAVLAAALLIPASAGAAERPNLIFDSSQLLQLEPLVITAPRVRAQREMIDPRINQHLLRLLAARMDARPDAAQALDSSLGGLERLTTLTGYNLKTRYTELGFLLTEGLAGTDSFPIQSELERVARLGKNVQTRAAALVALAYTKDLRFLPLFQGALLDPSVTVRLAAVEALLVLGGPSVGPQVGSAARADASLPVQAFAAAGMWRLGDDYGREILLRFLVHPDWLLRAMAAHYLGELGRESERWRILREFSFERDPVARAEMAGAALKIQAREEAR